MASVFLILASPSNSGSVPYAFSTLNSLGFSVFIVFIMLMILLWAHYYRMKDIRDRRGKRDKSAGDAGETVSQLQYMDREALKAMILKEKQDRENNELADTRDPATSVQKPDAAAAEKPTDANTATVVKNDSGQQFLPGFETAPAAGCEEKSELMLQAELIAKLTMPETVEGEDEKGEPKSPPSTPRHKVERSILSNELPEEFKGKSRKL